MPITVTAEDVRAVMGPYARAWTDDQIESSSVVLVAQRTMSEWCPTVDEIVDVEDMALAVIALANLVAAEMLLTAPAIRSSSIGDSSMSFAADAEQQRATRMQLRARELMHDVCPVPRASLPVFFRTASGRRGE